jgi:hypothetical protein
MMFDKHHEDFVRDWNQIRDTVLEMPCVQAGKAPPQPQPIEQPREPPAINVDSFSADDWARQFMAHHSGELGLDLSGITAKEMARWFACALMRGSIEGARRRLPL